MTEDLPDQRDTHTMKLISWNIARRAEALRFLPATSTRQLDFVFASTGLASQVRAKALNEPEDWGPNDHCRIEIDVE